MRPNIFNVSLAMPLFLGIFSGPSQAAPPKLNPWTVQTSIEARYIIDPNSDLVSWIQARPILPSPDGKRFALVTRRANLASNERIYEIICFDTTAVTDAVRSGKKLPPPLCKFEHHSNNVEPGITDLEWSDDGSYLLFAGSDNRQPDDVAEEQKRPAGDGLAQYRANLQTGNVELLCNGRRFKGVFVGTPLLVKASRNRALCIDFADQASPRDESPEKLAYPGEFITTEVYQRLINFPVGRHNNAQLRRFGLLVSAAGNLRPIAAISASSEMYFNVCGDFSPDGKTAIACLPADAADDGYRNYDAGANVSDAPDKAGMSSRISRFALVDLDGGQLHFLEGAFEGKATRMGATSQLQPSAIWSPSGDFAILVNTTLPLSQPLASSTSFVAAYVPATKSYEVITPIEADGRIVKAVRWAGDGQQLLIEWKQAALAGRQTDSEIPSLWTAYQRHDNRWSQLDRSPQAPAPAISWLEPKHQDELAGKSGAMIEYPKPQPLRFSNGLALTLQEGRNDLQTLVATVGNRQRTLLGPDPSLNNVEIARSEVVEWKTPDGQARRGLLTIPANRRPGKLPLVIQLGEGQFMPNVFRPDGNVKGNGQARQALVARGMAVLDLDMIRLTAAPHEKVKDKAPKEIALIAEDVCSALDKLVQDHEIDPARVGVTGFSHAGFVARSALLSPKHYRLRAAVAFDSFSASLAQFYSAVLNDPKVYKYGNGYGDGWIIDQLSLYHGGNPYEATPRWQSEAPDLAGNHATGALLNVEHNAYFPYYQLQQEHLGTAGAFAAAGRPFDLLAQPRAGHFLDVPLRAYVSTMAGVDWMDFWLNDHERTEPVMAAGETKEKLTEQYARWRQMRIDWDRQQAWEAAGHAAGSRPDPNFAVEATTRSQ